MRLREHDSVSWPDNRFTSVHFLTFILNIYFHAWVLYTCHSPLNILSMHIHLSISNINMCGKAIVKSKRIYKLKFRLMATVRGEKAGNLGGGPQGTSEAMMIFFS